MSDDRDLAIELLEELEVAANEGQAGKGPLRADYVATHVRSAIVQMRADRRELADKDAMWRTADRELAEAQRHIEALKREVCTCPWPEDAMRTRHLLSCRLMQMEHAAGQTALREAEDYPPGAACTRHLGEPWPCPRCVALREAEDA